MGDIETASFRSGSDGGTVHKIVSRFVSAAEWLVSTPGREKPA